MGAKLIGDEKIDAETLEMMRTSPYNFPDTKWAAYQNRDIGHGNLGHLRFIAVGPQNTIKEAPRGRLPDFPDELNWRYIFVGWADLASGAVVHEEAA